MSTPDGVAPQIYYIRQFAARILAALTYDWQTCTEIGKACGMHPGRVGHVIVRLLDTGQVEVRYTYGPELGLTKMKPHYRLKRRS